MSGGGIGLISGGGVSIGSGGGESIGFTGPWKSGIGGCSIMSDAGATTVPIAYGRAGIGARVGDAPIPNPDATQKKSRRLHIQPDRAHQLEGIAALDHAGAHAIVEDHLSVFESVFEMHVDG